MLREDADNLLNFPIAVIPTGEGNTLAKSIGAFDAITATYIAIKGDIIMDSLSLQRVTRNSLFQRCLFNTQR